MTRGTYRRHNRKLSVWLLSVFVLAAVMAAWLMTRLGTLGIRLPDRVLWMGYGGPTAGYV